MPDQWIDIYKKNGWSFFNTGTALKKSVTKWTDFQTRKPTEEEIEHWLKMPTQNYALVTGEISNLVVFDVDTKNGGDPTPFLNRGLYQVRTPSGGYHFYTTYDPLFKTTLHRKGKHHGILHAVDVQSNGAIVFCPPSRFEKGPYTLEVDAPITNLPDDLLADIVAVYEPEKDIKEFTPYTPNKTPENGRPGDIFNQLASWDDVLIPLGWLKVGRQSLEGRQFWRRPGKKDGISASTNYSGYDLFFPYTTHFDELIPRRGYTKYRLYAFLNHGGDFKVAAKALVMENYKIIHNRV